MTLTAILLLTLAGLLAGQIPPRWRTPALATLSILALFALQPASPVRNLDFWLPLAAISLTLAAWAAVQPREARLRPLLPAAALAGGLALLLSFNRNLDDRFYLTATRPPQVWIVGLALLACGLFVLILFALRGPWAVQAASLLILGIFVVLKSEPLSLSAAAGLRAAAGQDASLALATDLRWLGFSYLAFRLLSILRDSRSGRPAAAGPASPASPLQVLGYALFFPALSAGPIDRLPRFLTDLERRVDFPAIQAGLARIFTGLLKKFALADTLALVALTPAAAGQAAAGPWSWALLYAYGLRLYFDFSGYTDIAIGIGLLAGVRLPENFAAPYFKTNLTAFWNSWHITLAQWFRAYFFNPLTRWLRLRPASLPAWAIILIGQTGVMLLIGVWHGLTWNFAIWGLWHAAGLFIHNRWSDFIKPRLAAAPLPPRWQRLLSAGGWLLTFHYVTLGWVWFALPTPAAARDFLLKLVNLG